ncbi:P-type ATPase4 [Plasmodium gonderi]|uniref:P-type sodium-transporting ATPase4 n=1 Tax=Plasmodium gonderi TaxID=77519 RepID=A0A1Y1JPT6_PLAGO|nr:P-type ATPase4 [Plasmodium gonderi]GAW82852.1 P-type ATPase4 [Plasmodium gonderi]
MNSENTQNDSNNSEPKAGIDNNNRKKDHEIINNVSRKKNDNVSIIQDVEIINDKPKGRNEENKEERQKKESVNISQKGNDGQLGRREGLTRQEEVTKKKEEVTKQKEEISKQKEEVSKQKEEVTKHKEEVTKKKEEVSKQKEEVSKHKEEVTKKKEEVSKQKEEVSKQKEEVTKHKEEVTKKKEEVSKQKEEVSKQKEEVSKQKEEATKMKDEPAKLKDEPTKLKKKSSKLIEPMKKNEEEKNPVGYNHDAMESIENLCKEFDLKDLSSGLTIEQVKINREKYGENYIEKEDAMPLWLIFLSQYCSPVVMLLLVAATASLILNEIVEGVAIISIVTLNACLATYMEKSSGDAIAKLAEMASPQCTVLRNGQKILIPSREVVVGDVVIINTGDSISADLRLIEVIELKTNESLLTGESEDIKKTLIPDDYTTPFATNLCFATTSVTNGSGRGIVTATGLETQVGKIASQLKRSSKGSKLTPLQVSLNKLGGLIGMIAIIVLIFIITLAVLINYRDPAHADKDPLLVIIIIGVGFAVSSVPEGLPMVVTITLSAGAKDMVKKNANVRKLPAVETLGCCSVICSDKTGTLTEGKMTAINVVTFSKNSTLSDENNKLVKTFDFYPTKGFEPYGGIFDSNELTSEIKKKIVIAKNQGIPYDSILYNYGNPEYDSIDVKKIRSLMLAAYLNSYDTTLTRDSKTSKWAIHGNMSEGPIVVAAAKAGYSFITNENHNLCEMEYTRLDDLEVTFNSSRKMKITFYKLKTENEFEYIHLEGGNIKFTHIALIKGAPDKLLNRSTHLLEDSSKGPKICWEKKITENEKEILAKKNLELSRKALRVLAVCVKPLTAEHITLLKNLNDADERLNFVNSNEYSGYIPLGYIASFDPPRSGVKEAIQTCRDAQVKVIMITGDQKPTAIAIGKLIGLTNGNSQMKGENENGEFHSKEEEKEEGDDNDDEENSYNIEAIECSELHINKNPNEPVLPDEELDKFTDKIVIYSRAQPEDKITIVQSLKRKGYLVAMTGDGVNDAPALKAADIGVAMGINGTEVAKGASEMILIDDNFCTVVSAIDVGRTIFSNIQKFVCFLLGTNIGEILYLSIAIAAQMPFPLEALQILFLNLMTDGCPAVALSREPPNHDNMKTPPRPKKKPIMTKRWWFYGIIPHTIFEALCVLLSLALSLYLCTGNYTLNDIHNSCKTVHLPEIINGQIKHEFKYFCRTYEYRISPEYVGWVTNINFWHPKKKKTVTFWGAAKGKIDNISPQSNEIHPHIRTIMEDGCPENLMQDDWGWCKPRDDATVRGKDDKIDGTFPKNFEDVASKGSKRGRTMAFISAIWCEMLRAYTVRSWEPFYKVFNRNMWMHLACSISATMTFLSTCIPGITSVLNTTCLLWWQYLFGISWAVLNLILDEIIPKVMYRRKYMSVKS